MKATYVGPKCKVVVFEMKEYLQSVSPEENRSGISEDYGSSDDFCTKDNFGGSEWETF